MRLIKRFSPLLLSIGVGILGLLLRLVLFSAGVDSEKLLPSYHSASVASVVLAVAYFVFLAVTTVRTKKDTPDMSGACGIVAACGSVIAAIGIAFLGLYALRNPAHPMFLLLFFVSIPCAFCFLYVAWLQLSKKECNTLLYCGITIFFFVYPLAQYQSFSAQSQPQYYLFSVLCSVCLMLTVYHRACLQARRAYGRIYRFFAHSALTLSLFCLADDNWPFYLAMALWLVTELFLMQAQKEQAGMPLPRPVQYLICKLEKAGHRAYVVGGCVRDHLLGLTPHDYDLCTSALPEQVAALFAKHTLVRNGEKHGTIGVVLNHQVYEITTFRTEGGYSDSRHPDKVSFVTDVTQDLHRRDFTINAMAFSPKQGLIDPCGGEQDLQKRILRTVGTAADRFTEDALRILRGVRFAVRFGLTPDDDTLAAMLAFAPRMEYLAKERIYDELCKLLPVIKAEDLIRFAPIFTQIIPELAPCVSFDQHSPHHAYDIFTHTAHVVEAVPPVIALRWAALLHDIGKPEAFTQDENGRGHFYKHAEISTSSADKILRRLKAPNALREQVVFLIKHHMLPLEPDTKQLRRRLGKYGRDDLFALIALQRADNAGKGTDEPMPDFDAVEDMLEQLLEDASCFTVNDLAINGRDILALGYEAGPQIGACMRFLLDKVHEETLPNTKEELLAAAEVFLDREE